MDTRQPAEVVCYASPVADNAQPLLEVTTNDALVITGNVLSFVVPAIAFHGALECSVDATIGIGIADCEGFDACEAVENMDFPYPGRGVSFSTSI